MFCDQAKRQKDKYHLKSCLKLYYLLTECKHMIDNFYDEVLRKFGRTLEDMHFL